MLICILYLLGGFVAAYGAFRCIINRKLKIQGIDYTVTACGQAALALFLLAKGMSYLIYNGVFA